MTSTHGRPGTKAVGPDKMRLPRAPGMRSEYGVSLLVTGGLPTQRV
jgi:hypothetical protein